MHGYVACPITTAYEKLLLCEFDYTGKPTPTIPFINTVAERYDTWLLKRYGLPWLYWNLMLRGRDVPFLGARAIRKQDASRLAEQYTPSGLSSLADKCKSTQTLERAG